LNTGPKVEGEILALKRFIKNERRAVCMLCGISHFLLHV
jgi:hypothetical protein